MIRAMDVEPATAALFAAAFVAALVEGVETLTIVVAMGVSRGWRSTWAGFAAGVVVLVVATIIAGYSIARWLPEGALQLVVGTLLLIFGLQWLRKAVLRTSGRKALADEEAEYAAQTEAAQRAGARRRFGIDVFGFVVTFKAVVLEGAEVVFIVVTFGLSAGDMTTAVVAATAATVLVAGLGFALRRPLARVPENTLKYTVGLLLAAFGTYWAVQGVGVLLPGGEPLAWPGGDLAILGLVVVWLAFSRFLVAMLRRAGRDTQRRTRGRRRWRDERGRGRPAGDRVGAVRPGRRRRLADRRGGPRGLGAHVAHRLGLAVVGGGGRRGGRRWCRSHDCVRRAHAPGRPPKLIRHLNRVVYLESSLRSTVLRCAA